MSQKIAFYGRTLKKPMLPQVVKAFNTIVQSGGQICCHHALSGLLRQCECPLPPMEIWGPETALPQDCKVLVTLGGDGTFLSALREVRDSGIPLMGINYGRLGFLTGVDARNNPDWIDRLLAWEYQQTRHALLYVQGPEIPEQFFPYALNEVSVQRSTPTMIDIDVKAQGQDFPTYHSDGILVATPTGSTAYSLSVGGPIVFPEAEVMLLSPIAPHNLNLRTMVLPLDVELELTVRTRNPRGTAMLCVDNRSVALPSGATIRVGRAPFTLTGLRQAGHNYMHTLRDKLLWGFDRRNLI